MGTSIRENIETLREERRVMWESRGGVKLTEIAGKRNFTEAETIAFESAEKATEAFDQRIHALEHTAVLEDKIAEFSRTLPTVGDSQIESESRWINTDTGRPAALRSKSESFLSHEAARSARNDSDDGALAQYGNVGEMVRALTTSGTGSAIVPSSWSGQLIDLARSKSAVAQAGATIIPMNAKTVNIGRLTGDPSASFRAEGAAISASDATFDNVTLTAKSQSALVLGSLEFFQDADNAQEVVTNAIAEKIAENIDLNALYGGTITGAGSINLPTPPSPRGILEALKAQRVGNVLGGAANGTAQTAGSMWGELIDLLYTVRDGNEEPNAMLWSSKLARLYAKATATDGQPLQLPSDIDKLSRYTVNKIPSYTQGTMTTATDVFAGDFSQLLIGQRLSISLQVLTERFADTGQVGIMAHWRGDIQPARASAFAVYRGIKGA